MRHLIFLAVSALAAFFAAPAFACSAAPGPYVNYDPKTVPGCLELEEAFESDVPQVRVVNGCSDAVSVEPIDCELCGGMAELKPNDETVMVLGEEQEAGTVTLAWSVLTEEGADSREGSVDVSFGEYGGCGMGDDGTGNDFGGCNTSGAGAIPGAGALLVLLGLFGGTRRLRRRTSS